MVLYWIYFWVVLEFDWLIMKRFDNVSYDTQVNACYITINAQTPVVDTVSAQQDVFVDLDHKWDIVGIEVLNASEHGDLISKLILSREPIQACVSY